MEDLLKNPIIVDINNLMEEKRKECNELYLRICGIEEKLKDKHITVFEHENLVLELDTKKFQRHNLQSVIDGIDETREIVIDDIIKHGKEKEGMKEFDWDKFKGNTEMCVRCKTEDEANEFCKMMDVHGMKWCGGGSYLDNTCWDAYREDIVYYGDAYREDIVYYGDGTYGSAELAIDLKYTITEFSDYFKGGENK